MTALADWQAEVGGRLLVGDRPVLADPDTPAERAGWSVTLGRYRQLRLQRIRSLAPLTMARLGATADLIVDAYLAAYPGSTSYAAADAAGFLRFAAAARPEDRQLDEIAFLEQALIRARRPASADHTPSPGYLGRSRRASLRLLPFPASRLMLWLAGRGAMPPERPGGVPVLVAPDVSGWIRPATVPEAAAWHWLAMDRPPHLAGRVLSGALESLRRSGAVRSPR